MTTTQHVAHAGQVFARVVQFALAAIAIVGVLELLLVRPLGRWSG